MATRRQILEACLVAERVELWHDLAAAYEEDPFSERTHLLMVRIRRACEALGYPTSADVVPEGLGWLYLFVETDIALGISAERDDRLYLDPEIPEAVTEYHQARWSR